MGLTWGLKSQVPNALLEISLNNQYLLTDAKYSSFIIKTSLPSLISHQIRSIPTLIFLRHF